jgi:hypothetical protein
MYCPQSQYCTFCSNNQFSCKIMGLYSSLNFIYVLPSFGGMYFHLSQCCTSYHDIYFSCKIYKGPLYFLSLLCVLLVVIICNSHKFNTRTFKTKTLHFPLSLCVLTVYLWMIPLIFLHIMGDYALVKLNMCTSHHQYMYFLHSYLCTSLYLIYHISNKIYGLV